MWEIDFDPMQDLEVLTSHSNLMVIRTCKLLPTLKFMQGAWRKLKELTPDDEMSERGDVKEYNILTFTK